MGRPEENGEKGLTLFASEEDYAECARLHRQHGATYYFASRRLPAEARRRVDAVYGFVRVPDEIVDNPAEPDLQVMTSGLRAYRQEFLASTYGRRPDQPVLRAFADTLRECEIPLHEPMVFLDAMEADLTVTRYPTYADLRGYMRGSAVAVGMMMLYVLDAERDRANLDAAQALGEAMQLTNFLRDVGDDIRRGRIYLPLEDMAKFGVTEEDICTGRVTPAFRELMRFEIARARQLFDASDAGIERLPEAMRFGVALARELYAKILEKIEEADYNVFGQRARTTPQEKMVAAWKLWSGS